MNQHHFLQCIYPAGGSASQETCQEEPRPSEFIKNNTVGYYKAQLTTIPELAARILAAFREKAKSKGSREISATHLYEEFEGAGSHDMIQAAIRYLVDRDFIAPNSYSLTAKGMVKKIDTENKKRE